MFACNKWPLQTFFPLFFGTIIEPLGITVLAIVINTGHLPAIYGMLALTGVGTGIRFMPATLHGIAYNPNNIASIVSLMSLAINLGGTLATTIMINIFNNSLSFSGITLHSASSSSFSALTGMSAADQQFFKEKAKKGIVLAFFAITAFMWLGVFAAAALGNVRIGTKGRPDEVVVKGSWIGSVLFGKKKENEETRTRNVRAYV